MSFWRDVFKEEIWRLPESPDSKKNLPKFHQQELAALAISVVYQAEGLIQKILKWGLKSLLLTGGVMWLIFKVSDCRD